MMYDSLSSAFTGFSQLSRCRQSSGRTANAWFPGSRSTWRHCHSQQLSIFQVMWPDNCHFDLYSGQYCSHYSNRQKIHSLKHKDQFPKYTRVVYGDRPNVPKFIISWDHFCINLPNYSVPRQKEPFHASICQLYLPNSGKLAICGEQFLPFA